MTPLLESIFGLGCLITSVLFMVVTMRAISNRRGAEREFHSWLEGFLLAHDENRRMAELKILRHLKGQNYQGDLGDFEIFTDDTIPPGTAILPPAITSTPESL